MLSIYAHVIRSRGADFGCDPRLLHYLDDNRFLSWSGSGTPDHHHYGTGGLVQHTCEVLTISLESARLVGLNFAENAKQAIVYASLYHDIGKLWSYELDVLGRWAYSRTNKEQGHIARSYHEWMKDSAGVLSDYMIEHVAHAILAHHGFKDWGSPVTPKTRLAWLIHSADYMSANLSNPLETHHG